MTSDHHVKRRKKLIEVAIPLEAINAASAREKSIRHGHPSTLHLWWARRPLAAARAVIFCQMVDDPSAVPEEFPTEEAQENERLRLFALISELVTWENTTNEQVLNRAREEIKRSWRRACVDNADHPEAAELFNPEKLPGFHDPFAGGGGLPLEAQRLGVEAYASDLNPVAVLINKAMIEIPPKFAGMAPVNPETRSQKQLVEQNWLGAAGLAQDVLYYGKQLRRKAEERLGQLYPKVEITSEIINNTDNPRPDLAKYEGRNLTVIAWIWARTVESPNPAFAGVHVPLASTFIVSSKHGKEAYVEPRLTSSGYHFDIKLGKPSSTDIARKGTSAGKWNAFTCLLSGTPISYEYIREQGAAGKMKSRLMAVVAEGDRGRVYISPTKEQEDLALSASPSWRPEVDINYHPRDIKTQIYGLTKYCDLFTDRQLAGLSTLCELAKEQKTEIEIDAINAGMRPDQKTLKENGSGASAYSESVLVYMQFLIDQLANHSSSICGWNHPNTQMRSVFSRQAIPMSWDYAEVNIFSESSGSYLNLLERQVKAFQSLPVGTPSGIALQRDAADQDLSLNKVVSTDPPYYDNIGYADLSDFFYIWLRKTMKEIYPDLFATLKIPKSQELVATPYRHGGKKAADEFFLSGMIRSMRQLVSKAHKAFPVTIYYAFKQSESTSSSGTVSTGWETFLEAVIESGLSVCGTWPIRTEKEGRITGIGSNALASSVVLVCTINDGEKLVASRSEFRRLLRQHLPVALKSLENSNIAPVDVAQAAIGPGMAIYSSAKAVLNPDDSPMTVREALAEINAALDEYLSQDEGDLDADSRFALTFFESYSYSERDFGDAENLAKARNISVSGVAEAGVLRSIGGKVKLLHRSELDEDWDPTRDKRLCIWEATQQLIRRLESDGESAAAALLTQLKQISGHGDLAANCRALAYRLYNHCEKTKQAEEARAYNGLVIAWPELERLASSQSIETTLQASLI